MHGRQAEYALNLHRREQRRTRPSADRAKPTRAIASAQLRIIRATARHVAAATPCPSATQRRLLPSRLTALRRPGVPWHARINRHRHDAPAISAMAASMLILPPD